MSGTELQNRDQTIWSKFKYWSRIVSIPFIVLVFFFLFKSLWQNWSQVNWSDLHFNWLYFLGSVLAVQASFLLSTHLWRLLLRQMQTPLSYPQALNLIGTSQLGKYLPGGIWMIASRVYTAEKEELSKANILLGSLVEQEFTFLVALVLSIVFLGFQGPLLKLDFTSLNIICLAAAALLLNPYSLEIFMRWGKKLLRSQAAEWKIGLRLYFIMVSGYALCWMLQGLGFFLMLKSFAGAEFFWLKKTMGVYFLSWLIGFVAIFAPGGLGVREATMAVLLQGLYPTGLAVTISLVSRIWSTLQELILAGMGVLVRNRR
jgi:uncharacterized membrane protein YbhN (UPF0104 family)